MRVERLFDKFGPEFCALKFSLALVGRFEICLQESCHDAVIMQRCILAAYHTSDVNGKASLLHATTKLDSSLKLKYTNAVLAVA